MIFLPYLNELIALLDCIYVKEILSYVNDNLNDQGN